jgi:hypothetical protein
MVTGEHHYGVVSAPAGIKCPDQLPDLRVHVCAGRKVGTTSCTDFVDGYLPTVQVNTLENPFGVWILLVEGYGWSGRQWDVDSFVEVPVVFRHGVGVVRMGHGDGEAEGLISTVPSVVVKILSGFVYNFVVKVKLVCSNTWASLENGGHVVIPICANLLSHR